MSKYTTEVRFICESAAGLVESAGASDVDNIIDNSWLEVVGVKWPCWGIVPEGGGTYTYHAELAKKILKHYYTREIGFETVGLWKLKLNTKLNEIMPYYVELYETVAKKYDWFKDVDYYREHEGSGSGDNSETTSGEGSYENERTDSGWSVFSDTPQGSLVNVENETYLTNATKQTGSNSGSGSNTSSGTRSGEYSDINQYIDHVYGKMPGKSYATMVKEYRENLINIDMMVIDELKDLFMKIW